VKASKLAVLFSAVALCLLPLTSVSKDKSPDTVVLTADNLLILNSEVSGESVGKVMEDAKALDAKLSGPMKVKDLAGKKKPLYLFLNTPGGSIQAGLELIEALKGMGRPVHTVTQFAASMGFQIVQNMDDRIIMKNGVLMSHHAAGQMTGSFGGEEPSQMSSRQQLWLDRVRELDEQTVKRTNGKQTYASYIHQYNPEMWLTGSKSVAQGYADRVASIRCDSSLDGVTSHSALAMGIIPVTYDLSNCPLNSSPMNIKIKVETNHGMVDEDDFLKRGGEFGASCLTSSIIYKLCALDTSLNKRRISDLKRDFITTYLNKQKQVINMYW
jgi:ATP-dependent protease ClpP protease subunit